MLEMGRLVADDGLLPVERLVFPKSKQKAVDPFVGSTPWSLTPINAPGGPLLTFDDLPAGSPKKEGGSSAGNFLNVIFETLTTPGAIVTSTINEITDLARANGDASFGDWFKQMTFNNHITGQDLLFGEKGKPDSGWGWNREDVPGWQQFLFGFGVDAFTDPLTYIVPVGPLRGQKAVAGRIAEKALGEVEAVSGRKLTAEALDRLLRGEELLDNTYDPAVAEQIKNIVGEASDAMFKVRRQGGVSALDSATAKRWGLDQGLEIKFPGAKRGLRLTTGNGPTSYASRGYNIGKTKLGDLLYGGTAGPARFANLRTNEQLRWMKWAVRAGDKNSVLTDTLDQIMGKGTPEQFDRLVNIFKGVDGEAFSPNRSMLDATIATHLRDTALAQKRALGDLFSRKVAEAIKGATDDEIDLLRQASHSVDDVEEYRSIMIELYAKNPDLAKNFHLLMEDFWERGKTEGLFSGTGWSTYFPSSMQKHTREVLEAIGLWEDGGVGSPGRFFERERRLWDPASKLGGIGHGPDRITFEASSYQDAIDKANIIVNSKIREILDDASHPLNDKLNSLLDDWAVNFPHQEAAAKNGTFQLYDDARQSLLRYAEGLGSRIAEARYARRLYEFGHGIQKGFPPWLKRPPGPGGTAALPWSPEGGGGGGVPPWVRARSIPFDALPPGPPDPLVPPLSDLVALPGGRRPLELTGGGRRALPWRPRGNQTFPSVAEFVNPQYGAIPMEAGPSGVYKMVDSERVAALHEGVVAWAKSLSPDSGRSLPSIRVTTIDGGEQVFPATTATLRQAAAALSVPVPVDAGKSELAVAFRQYAREAPKAVVASPLTARPASLNVAGSNIVLPFRPPAVRQGSSLMPVGRGAAKAALPMSTPEMIDSAAATLANIEKAVLSGTGTEQEKALYELNQWFRNNGLNVPKPAGDMGLFGPTYSQGRWVPGYRGRAKPVEGHASPNWKLDAPTAQMKVNYARAVMNDLKVAFQPTINSATGAMEVSERWHKVFLQARQNGASDSSAAWMTRVFREFENAIATDTKTLAPMAKAAAAGDQEKASELLGLADALGINLVTALNKEKLPWETAVRLADLNATKDAMQVREKAWHAVAMAIGSNISRLRNLRGGNSAVDVAEIGARMGGIGAAEVPYTNVRGNPIEAAQKMGGNAYAVIPTNTVVRKDGQAVMGAGLAKLAAKLYPDLPEVYGRRLQEGVTFYVDHDRRLILVPTKEDWKEPSTMEIVSNALNALARWARSDDAPANLHLVLPGMGTGNGGLNPKKVEELIAKRLRGTTPEKAAKAAEEARKAAASKPLKIAFFVEDSVDDSDAEDFIGLIAKVVRKALPAKEKSKKVLYLHGSRTSGERALSETWTPDNHHVVSFSPKWDDLEGVDPADIRTGKRGQYNKNAGRDLDLKILNEKPDLVVVLQEPGWTAKYDAGSFVGEARKAGIPVLTHGPAGHVDSDFFSRELANQIGSLFDGLEPPGSYAEAARQALVRRSGKEMESALAQFQGAVMPPEAWIARTPDFSLNSDYVAKEALDSFSAVKDAMQEGTIDKSWDLVRADDGKVLITERLVRSGSFDDWPEMPRSRLFENEEEFQAWLRQETNIFVGRRVFESSKGTKSSVLRKQMGVTEQIEELSNALTSSKDWTRLFGSGVQPHDLVGLGVDNPHAILRGGLTAPWGYRTMPAKDALEAIPDLVKQLRAGVAAVRDHWDEEVNRVLAQVEDLRKLSPEANALRKRQLQEEAITLSDRAGELTSLVNRAMAKMPREGPGDNVELMVVDAQVNAWLTEKELATDRLGEIAAILNQEQAGTHLPVPFGYSEKDLRRLTDPAVPNTGGGDMWDEQAALAKTLSEIPEVSETPYGDEALLSDSVLDELRTAERNEPLQSATSLDEVQAMASAALGQNAEEIAGRMTNEGMTLFNRRTKKPQQGLTEPLSDLDLLNWLESQLAQYRVLAREAQSLVGSKNRPAWAPRVDGKIVNPSDKAFLHQLNVAVRLRARLAADGGKSLTIKQLQDTARILGADRTTFNPRWRKAQMLHFFDELLHNVRVISDDDWSKLRSRAVRGGKIDAAALAEASEKAGVGARESTMVRGRLDALRAKMKEDWPEYERLRREHDAAVLQGVESTTPAQNAVFRDWAKHQPLHRADRFPDIDPRDENLTWVAANSDEARRWWDTLRPSGDRMAGPQTYLTFAERHVADQAKRYGNYREGLLNISDGGKFKRPVRRPVNSVFKISRTVGDGKVTVAQRMYNEATNKVETVSKTFNDYRSARQYLEGEHEAWYHERTSFTPASNYRIGYLEEQLLFDNAVKTKGGVQTAVIAFVDKPVVDEKVLGIQADSPLAEAAVLQEAEQSVGQKFSHLGQGELTRGDTVRSMIADPTDPYADAPWAMGDYDLKDANQAAKAMREFGPREGQFASGPFKGEQPFRPVTRRYAMPGPPPLPHQMEFFPPPRLPTTVNPLENTARSIQDAWLLGSAERAEAIGGAQDVLLMMRDKIDALFPNEPMGRAAFAVNNQIEIVHKIAKGGSAATMQMAEQVARNALNETLPQNTRSLLREVAEQVKKRAAVLDAVAAQPGLEQAVQFEIAALLAEEAVIRAKSGVPEGLSAVLAAERAADDVLDAIGSQPGLEQVIGNPDWLAEALAGERATGDQVWEQLQQAAMKEMEDWEDLQLGVGEAWIPPKAEGKTRDIVPVRGGGGAGGRKPPKPPKGGRGGGSSGGSGGGGRRGGGGGGDEPPWGWDEPPPDDGWGDPFGDGRPRDWEEASRATEDFAERLDKDPKAREALGRAFDDLQFRMLAPGILTPKYLADFLYAQERMVYNTNGFWGKFLKGYRAVIRWQKVWQITSPGFMSRNFVGGVMNNALADVEADSYFGLMRLMKKVRAGTASAEEQQVWKSISEHVDPGQALSEAYLGSAGAQVAGRGRPSKNPFSSRSWFPRFIVGGNEKVEFILRGSNMYDSLVNKGFSIDEAVQRMYKFHFNYSDLGKYDQVMRDNFVPFWTWMKNNVPLQMQMLAENPKVYARIAYLKRNYEGLSERDKFIPGFFTDVGAWQTPFGKKDHHWFYTPDLPLKDLNVIGNPLMALLGKDDTQDAGGVFTDAFSEPLSAVTPLILSPFEWYSKSQVYKGLPLRDDKPVAFKQLFHGWLPDWLARPLMLTKAVKFQDGKAYMSSRDVYLVEKNIPIFATYRRLVGGEPEMADKRTSRLLSWALGLQMRENTKELQQAENYRRALEKEKRERIKRLMDQVG